MTADGVTLEFDTIYYDVYGTLYIKRGNTNWIIINKKNTIIIKETRAI